MAMSPTAKIGLKLERMAYELRMMSGTLKANGNQSAQIEYDAIVALMAELGDRLNPAAAPKAGAL